MDIALLVSLIPFPIVREMAVEFDINPHLIAAIIIQESNGNTCAIRFEPRWRYYWNTKYWARLVGSSWNTEVTGQATSWGLMQVIGTVARERGFTGWFPQLCQPETGIYYGAKVLSRKLTDYPNDHDAIAAYNAGSPRRWTPIRIAAYMKKYPKRSKPKLGDYVNQEYVDNVVAHLNELENM